MADSSANAPSVASPATSNSQLPRQVRRGISWNVVGAISTNLMRLLVVVVLGRLLTPADFGPVAAALSVITIFHMVRDLGIGPALIQRQQLDDGHVSTAFATSLYIGLAIAGIIFVGAPLSGVFFHNPAGVPILRTLALIFALRGMSATSQMLCQRAMNFRAVALIDSAAYTANSVISMAMAAEGYGPWSLVAGYLVEEGLSTLIYLVLAPPKFSLRIQRDKLRDLLGFGVGQTLFQVVNALATQGDNFVVGHSLGEAKLGYYTRAYDLFKLPGAVFTNLVGNVLFPAFSRLQGDRERLGAGFRRMIFVNALILIPMSAVLIVIAPEAIRVLMGPRWNDAVLPFQILALVMLMRVSYKGGVLVALAAGAVYGLTVVNVVYAVAVVAGAALMVPWGIPGIAASTAGSIVIMYVLSSWLGMQQCSLRWPAFVVAHVPGLAIGGVLTALLWPAAEALRNASVLGPIRLAIICVAGVLISLAMIAVWLRRARGDFGWLGGELGVVRNKLLGRRKRAPLPVATALPPEGGA